MASYSISSALHNDNELMEVTLLVHSDDTIAYIKNMMLEIFLYGQDFNSDDYVIIHSQYVLNDLLFVRDYTINNRSYLEVHPKRNAVITFIQGSNVDEEAEERKMKGRTAKTIMIRDDDEKKKKKIQYLSNEQVENLLSKVKPLKSKENDIKKTNIHPLTKRRCLNLSGKHKVVAFSPDKKLRANDEIEQEIIEFPKEGEDIQLFCTPQGEVVNPVPRISITFSDPMIAMSSLKDISEVVVPAQITPSCIGKWSWLDPVTLQFIPDKRLAMASEYAIVIPAGTRSILGSTIPSDKVFKITTQAPKIKSITPRNLTQNLPLDTKLKITFSSRIDIKSLQQICTLKSSSKTYKIIITELVKEGKCIRNNDHTLIIETPHPFQKNTKVSWSLKGMIKSAEGPLKQKISKNGWFSTFTGMQVQNSNFSSIEKGLKPYRCFLGTIYMTNEIDASTFSFEDRQNLLSIVPADKIKDVDIDIVSNRILITGLVKPLQEYTITVKAGLRDCYNQASVEDEKIRFLVGPIQFSNNSRIKQSLCLDSTTEMQIIDPFNPKPSVTFQSCNFKRVILRFYSVQPKDFMSYRKYTKKFKEQTYKKR